MLEYQQIYSRDRTEDFGQRESCVNREDVEYAKL